MGGRVNDDSQRRYVLLLVSALTLIALVCVLGLVRVPYVWLAPGPAVDTLGTVGDKSLIEFDKSAKTYPTRGHLDFTSVRVTSSQQPVTLLDVISEFFSPDTVVAPRELLYPKTETSKQSEDELNAEMQSSKDFSRVAALRAAGYDVSIEPAVASVATGMPAHGVLRPDDVIVSVDGRRPDTVEAVVKAVSSRKPGTPVHLVVRRRDAERSFTVGTVKDPRDKRRARMGVGLRPKIHYPFEITNNVARVGGPSAGTMFALAIYDRLTPGALTGGLHVAGTGSIDPDGNVGPIGGIRQKMAGASAAKASVFLVPAENCREALLDADGRGRVDGMRLVRVTTLDGAIRALRALSKDGSASVPTCGTPDEVRSAR